MTMLGSHHNLQSFRFVHAWWAGSSETVPVFWPSACLTWSCSAYSASQKVQPVSFTNLIIPTVHLSLRHAHTSRHTCDMAVAKEDIYPKKILEYMEGFMVSKVKDVFSTLFLIIFIFLTYKPVHLVFLVQILLMWILAFFYFHRKCDDFCMLLLKGYAIFKYVLPLI